MPRQPLMRGLLLTLGLLWALPISLSGLVAGLIAMAFGARPALRTGDLALVFQCFPWGPGGAITLGNVILHTGPDLACPCRTYACRAGLVDEPTIVLADHERAHVYQYMVLGLLLLPLYLLSGGAVSERNRFEQAADRYARTGRGWWPWARDDMK
ncbi:MAG: hypothetical protein JSS23_03670 [Proteobacteria bacterium]|nr:hypothetical protein [Pseudomonadota bacterium]